MFIGVFYLQFFFFFELLKSVCTFSVVNFLYSPSSNLLLHLSGLTLHSVILLFTWVAYSICFLDPVYGSTGFFSLISPFPLAPNGGA